MKVKYSNVLLVAVSILILCAMVSADSIQEINYSIPQTTINPNFVVRELKYEPYPVNAGDWFDLWVKVENIGQTDAPNARFEIVPEYPFSSNGSLARDYGKVYGTVSAYKVSQEGDANQIILQYRLRVADNAPEGISNLKFLATTDKNDFRQVAAETDLPIAIAKTKTDFDVSLQNVNPQESSFIITNVGQNIAKAVNFEVLNQDGIILLSGAEPSIIGDLDKGDFTITHAKALPKEGTKNISVRISYTDTAGVRDIIEKTITIDQSKTESACSQATNNNYIKWIFGVVGFITGAFIIIIVSLIKRKRHASK